MADIGSFSGVGFRGAEGGVATFSGLDRLRERLQVIYKDLSGPALREALYAAAGIVKAALEEATPVDTGTAKANVIIHQRKARSKYYTGPAAEEDLSLLIGYEKQSAYYMYFVEYGRTVRRDGDVVVRTRAGGKSQTKYFRPEDLFLGSTSDHGLKTKRGWTKTAFGRAAAGITATGGRKIAGRGFARRAFDSTEDTALKAAEASLRQHLSGLSA